MNEPKRFEWSWYGEVNWRLWIIGAEFNYGYRFTPGWSVTLSFGPLHLTLSRWPEIVEEVDPSLPRWRPDVA